MPRKPANLPVQKTQNKAQANQHQKQLSSEIYERLSQWGAFGLLGEAFGLILGIFIPDTWVSDSQLGHICAMLFAGLNELGLFPKQFRTPSGQGLANCLADANLLFAQKLLNQREHRKRRNMCIQEHSP